MAEAFFPDFALLLYLEELTKEEFWKFKELLKQELLKLERSPIPWTELKKAPKDHVATLLDKQYPGKRAWEVMLSLFLQINRRDLWTKGQNDMRNKFNTYKRHMKDKFRRVWEKETCLEVPEEFYEGSVKKEYEQVGSVYEVAEAEGPAATVVLYGVGGSGKTTFLRKLMLEWAEGNLWKERFEFVFFLNMYEMNNISETSLVQFISRDWPESSEPIEEVFSQPRRILFIMDGFEELKFYPDLDNLCSDWTQDLATPVLLSSLLRRKMLPETSLLLALGTTAMKKYFYMLQYPQYIKIPGLSASARKLYFSHLLGEKHQAAKAFDLVKDQTKLFLLCQYPLGCWLVCSCLKWQLERGEDFSVTIHSTTSLYASFVTSVIKSGLKTFSLQQSTAKLKALCTLAAEGIWMDRFAFRLGDLQRNGIRETDASMWVGMQFLRRNEDRITFAHVCIQGFFAALWYLLRRPGSRPHQTIRSVSRVVEATVTLAPHYLVQTGFFLFGLSAEKMTSALQEFFDVPLSKEIQPEIIKCLRSLSRCVDSEALVRFKELFNSLFETREEEFTAQVMSLFHNIHIYINHADDFVVSAFCLKNTHGLQRLYLSIEHLFPDDREHLLTAKEKLAHWRDFCSVFSNSEDFQVLNMDGCVFDDAAHTILWKSLIHPTCKLRKLMYNYSFDLGNAVDFFRVVLHNVHLTYLNLHGTNLSREQVKKLCEMLKHPFCNLEQLMLGKCDITQESCAEIASVLPSNRKLKLLSLVENPLMHQGALALCDALKQPACPLEKLLLKFCCLTSATCDCISEALLCSVSLSVLDLGSNTLKDEGVAHFCKTLKYPSCVLKELWLDMCELTTACCEDLASALTFGTSLKSLNLDWNNLGHDGVAMLCEALSHPDCVLELLGLDKHAFAEETQGLLKAVEEKNPQLRILHQPWEAEEDKMRGVPLAPRAAVEEAVFAIMQPDVRVTRPVGTSGSPQSRDTTAMVGG
ncbi:NACHT, LRR and PYD domains-containing protein 9 [Glossophaga mutica]